MKRPFSSRLRVGTFRNRRSITRTVSLPPSSVNLDPKAKPLRLTASIIAQLSLNVGS
jgi:hypothetical protein